MSTEPISTEPVTTRPLLAPFASRNPWLIIILGILEIILGAVMLFTPFLSGLVAMWVGGFIFLFLAALMVVQLFSSGSKTGMLWNILSIILLIIVGIYMLNQSVAALGAWTLVIGVYILVAGIFRLVMAFRLKGSRGFGWALFNGIISIILGLMITFGWPQSSIWFIGTLVGIEFIITGWTMIALGIAGNKLKKDLKA